MRSCDSCGMNKDEVVGRLEITDRLPDGTVLRMCAECHPQEERKADGSRVADTQSVRE